MSPSLRRPLAHAARVAAVVAALFAVLYVTVAVAFDYLDARHLVAHVDGRLADRLADIGRQGLRPTAAYGLLPVGTDVDDAPLVLWRPGPGAASPALIAGAPSLPNGEWSRWARPATAVLGRDDFRLMAAREGTTWLVAGQSLAAERHVESVVAEAEIVGGPVLALAVFASALVIGLVASRPIEQARRRQLEFTADASHELRTPLTVIEAEVGVALSTAHRASAYREALQRVGTEGQRLRHIVEDLLFLARFDSNPPAPPDEPVDLVTLAEASAQRFSAVAEARGVDLLVVTRGGGAMLNAPPAWLDRLCGVLVDNACRHAGAGGSVRVIVTAGGSSVSLAVEDTGPGIPAEERPFLFDRFHRGTDDGQGAGLGLAIADAVVSSSGGRWRVADSPGGGAHMEVVWRRPHLRDRALGKELRVRSRRATAAGDKQPAAAQAGPPARPSGRKAPRG
jgi:signal transduction histidine kinase